LPDLKDIILNSTCSMRLIATLLLYSNMKWQQGSPTTESAL